MRDDSFEQLAHAIGSLMKKAYAGADAVTKDELAGDSSINAVDDGRDRERLRDRAPITHYETVREADRLMERRKL